MYYTAHIRTSDGFVSAVTSTTGPLADPPAGIEFITLDAYHAEYAGWTYVNGAFTNPNALARPIDHQQQNRAMVLGRAALLDKKGQFNQASALRATIGA